MQVAVLAAADAAGDIDIESLIREEDMVVTVTSGGYIKRTALADFRAQKRGGKGRSGMSMRDEDFVDNIFVSNTHTPMVFFSTDGIAYQMKVYRLPLASPNSLGKPIINMLPIKQGESIATILPLPEDEAEWENMHVM